jgi:serine/threonine-protein kinase
MPTTESEPGTAGASWSRIPQPGRGTFIVAGVARVVLGFLLLHACSGGSDGRARPGAKASAKSTTSAPTTVRVSAADYLGRPVDDVTRELRRAGLEVATNAEPSTLRPGTVTAITPTGALREGTTVTVTVAVESPKPKPKPDKGKPGKGHGR